MSVRISLIVSLLISNTAYAECYVRTAMSNQIRNQITEIADIQKLVVPISSLKNKCVVNFRAQLENEWYTIEGEATGPKTDSAESLCVKAINTGKQQLLTQYGDNDINMEQDFVCSDQEALRIKTVNIGDKIKESEIAPHPNFPKRFEYRKATCRWFLEPEPRVGDIIQRQGIACLVSNNEWQVIDKW